MSEPTTITITLSAQPCQYAAALRTAASAIRAQSRRRRGAYQLVNEGLDATRIGELAEQIRKASKEA
jgi:hypothetical protein